ncbi:hypothetical protein Kisp01_66130 [Kineosporia sp. NBRC 101677]|nr:hypothetical protein Kisp01_66130 [Kineosporia sp. NBRC 101677]
MLGTQQHPLYGALTMAVPVGQDNQQFREDLRGHGLNPTEDPDVLWSFERFVISRDGRPVARFGPKVAPDDPALPKVLNVELAAG